MSERSDFVRPSRPISQSFVSGRGHYDTVIKALREARTSVWIATANLKSLMVEDLRWSARRKSGGRAYRSVVEIFSELVGRGVELRLLHAALPSRPFRAELLRNPELSTKRASSTPPAGSFEMRLCPRNHVKAVVVDGAFLYLGSANFTGAGLGAKGSGRRNFEVGFITDDALLLDDVQEMLDRIWRGAECKACQLRRECPKPLDEPSTSRRALPMVARAR